MVNALIDIDMNLLMWYNINYTLGDFHGKPIHSNNRYY